MIEVQAEIAANVWQVPAEEGQMIAEGDTIAILESMKMEIPVEAPVSGTIAEIRVKPEDQVNEGDVPAGSGGRRRRRPGRRDTIGGGVRPACRHARGQVRHPRRKTGTDGRP